MNGSKTVQKRKMKGVVISAKMKKTVVVSIPHIVWNAKYRKQYRLDRKYKAHDEKNEYREGDTVIIEETRPISKEKKWRVLRLVAHATDQAEPVEGEDSKNQSENS